MSKLAFGLILLVVSCAPVAVARNPFAGTWKTAPIEPQGTVTYSRSDDGKEHYSNNRNLDYAFGIDGKEYSTGLPASTVTWNKMGDSAWDYTEKVNDRVVQKGHVVLAPDGQTLTTTYTWFNPGDRRSAGSRVFRRLSGESGLEGTWKLIKRVEEPDTFTIAFPVPGQMYVYVDPIDNTWVGPTDGTFMAVQSPLSPPGTTAAYWIAGPRKMTLQTKSGDTTILGTFEVSADGRMLTRTTWIPDKSDSKIILILERQ